jgi:hypothetical protein
MGFVLESPGRWASQCLQCQAALSPLGSLTHTPPWASIVETSPEWLCSQVVCRREGNFFSSLKNRGALTTFAAGLEESALPPGTNERCQFDRLRTDPVQVRSSIQETPFPSSTCAPAEELPVLGVSFQEVTHQGGGRGRGPLESPFSRGPFESQR